MALKIWSPKLRIFLFEFAYFRGILILWDLVKVLILLCVSLVFKKIVNYLNALFFWKKQFQDLQFIKIKKIF